MRQAFVSAFLNIIQLKTLFVMPQYVTRVAIADDNPMFRYLLNKKIAEMNDFQIVIEATNGLELIDKIKQSYALPQICILDIGMPVMDGYTAIKIIIKKWSSIKVLVFSQYHHDYAIGYMLVSGARGFISKEENTECLYDALVGIRDNGYYYSKYADKKLFELAAQFRLKPPAFTQMEKKLIALFASDESYKDIAQKLFTSVHTVQKHKQNIFKKTGINSREGLILFALKNELGILI
jgi:two-component system, NarL family, invasion response regulator UvrY